MQNLPNHDGVVPTGTQVELRFGCEGFYKVAKPGWRGTVRDRKLDKDGFECVYVEWDKNYWRYEEGQPDGWTYPNHFNILGAPPRPTQQLPDHGPDDPAPAEVHSEADPDSCPHCGEVHTEEDNREAYMNAVVEAGSHAAEGDGFAIFFVKRDEHEEGVVDVVPYFASLCLTDEAQALIETQLVQVALDLVQQMNLQRLERRDQL